VVLTCIAARPASRPTAAQVVKVLDKMIRNIVNKVKKLLPPEEEQLLRQQAVKSSHSRDQFTDDADLDDELKQLYTHLLATNPREVDALITKAFAQGDQPMPKLSASAPAGGYSPQQPPQYNNSSYAPSPAPAQTSPASYYPQSPAPSKPSASPLVALNASGGIPNSSANLNRSAPTTQYPPAGYAYNPSPNFSTPLAPSSNPPAPGREAASPVYYGDKSPINSTSSTNDYSSSGANPALKPTTSNVDSLLSHNGIVPRISPTNSSAPTASVPTAPSPQTLLSAPAATHNIDQLLDLDGPLSPPPKTASQVRPVPHVMSAPATGSLVDLPEPSSSSNQPIMGALVDLPLPSVMAPPAVMATPPVPTPPKTPSPTPSSLVDFGDSSAGNSYQNASLPRYG